MWAAHEMYLSSMRRSPHRTTSAMATSIASAVESEKGNSNLAMFSCTTYESAHSTAKSTDRLALLSTKKRTGCIRYTPLMTEGILLVPYIKRERKSRTY